MKTKVQIVIPSINLWSKYTLPCIHSVIAACKDVDYRIYFIDNGSEDETALEAAKLVSDTFFYHGNQESWGCAQSWNFGVKDAIEMGYDYAFILNNDILLHPESVNELVKRFENAKTNKVVVVPSGPVALEDNLDVVLEDDILAMVSCMDIRSECDRPEDVLTKSVQDKDGVEEAEHPHFSAFMLSLEQYQKVGEFDENFKPAYFEDNDYHYRIELLGKKAIVLPTAMFYHYGSRTQNEAKTKPIVTSDLFEANRDYYVKKWGGVPGREQYKTPFNQ